MEKRDGGRNFCGNCRHWDQTSRELRGDRLLERAELGFCRWHVSTELVSIASKRERSGLTFEYESGCPVFQDWSG